METRLLIAYWLIGLLVVALVIGARRLRARHHEERRLMRGHGRYKRRRAASRRALRN